MVRGVNTREESHWSDAWQLFKLSKALTMNSATIADDVSRMAALQTEQSLDTQMHRGSAHFCAITVTGTVPKKE
jgi:hypothetical protein